MSFSFIGIGWRTGTYIAQGCRRWTDSKADRGSWSSVSEAISAMAEYFSSLRHEGNSNWVRKDILKWMKDSHIEIEFM